MARRWDVISWSGRTGSLNGGSLTRAGRRLGVKATGQAGEKGRSGQVENTCCGHPRDAVNIYASPPRGPEALRCRRYGGTRFLGSPRGLVELSPRYLTLKERPSVEQPISEDERSADI